MEVKQNRSAVRKALSQSNDILEDNIFPVHHFNSKFKEIRKRGGEIYSK